MPRLPRFNLIGVPQHLIQRGNNRQACFFDEDDYLFYLDCLRDASASAGCDIHAYVLMTNHVHILATPQREHAASRMMQSIGRRYVQRVNHRYQRTGTLWEGRFRAGLVEAERYLLTCYRYIEMNPVRARGMVEHPRDYRWSSYQANAVGGVDPWLTPHPLYRSLGRTDAERRAAYRDLFSDPLDADALREIRESARQGVVLGSEVFRAQIAATLEQRTKPGQRGRPKNSRGA